MSCVAEFCNAVHEECSDAGALEQTNAKLVAAADVEMDTLHIAFRGICLLFMYI